MVNFTASDTIRILVATDNHVGYAERDTNRGSDSARTFDEIMRLAKDRDVDMVLLAGDLFHDNKPSRKSMYEVMRSLRVNCFGDKPCELQMLSDASEVFQGAFNHANYEDEDLNVAIPVFSIHGNHDDPSGEGHYAALDLLQISGLLNYYGRVPESDNIDVKPVLLQKGKTKLALYGLSNVRDERLFRTFRDGRVKFYQPRTQKDDWFNLLSVHQNHHAYTDTGYLPENFLPAFMDLVVWGHEHECLIDPTMNPEMGFHVMQPGSSVATSLSPGEAVPKHVAILSITGKDFTCESIRLKSVRPFVTREIVLSDDKDMKAIVKKSDNRTQITRHLSKIVDEMIEEARRGWAELQDDLPRDEEEWPKPLIRLRVEYSAPEGGKYDCENPQRFSNRFHGRVANVSDVVQFHRKKRAGGIRSANSKPEMPDEEAIAALSIDNVKVDELVKEFLEAQSLICLPRNSFGDAVGEFVEKGENQAVNAFVKASLDSQVKHLLKAKAMNDDDMANAMEEYKDRLEQLFGQGHLNRNSKAAAPRPENWDSDLEGDWNDHAPAPRANGDGGIDMNEEEEDDQPRPRGRNAKSTAKAKPAARKPAAATKKAPAKKASNARSRKKAVSEDEEDEDVVMIDDDDDDGDLLQDEEEEESQGLFVSERSTRAAPSTTRRASPPKKAPAKAARKAPSKATKGGKQSTLNFFQPSQPSRPAASRRAQEVSDDEISDDDDAFEPVPSTARPARSRR